MKRTFFPILVFPFFYGLGVPSHRMPLFFIVARAHPGRIAPRAIGRAAVRMPKGIGRPTRRPYAKGIGRVQNTQHFT